MPEPKIELKSHFIAADAAVVVTGAAVVEAVAAEVVTVDAEVVVAPLVFLQVAQTIASFSILHSLTPRLILKNPFSPQLVPHEFLTFQYLTPFSFPYPTTTTAWFALLFLVHPE